jgi:uncharacterized protein (TIGR02466 family)
MIEQIKFEKIFYTPLVRFRLPNYDALNAEILLESQTMRSTRCGVSKSNLGGWHSKGNLFDRDVACIRTVRDAATAAVFDATRKTSKKVDPESLQMRLFAWMNANPPGSYNAPHTHPMAHWSGVYYVSQPKAVKKFSGMIEFLDPRSDLPNWRILGGSAFLPKRRIRPEAGELIIFPSYLSHWVHPNDSHEERVTIAFNATFRKARLKT